MYHIKDIIVFIAILFAMILYSNKKSQSLSDAIKSNTSKYTLSLIFLKFALIAFVFSIHSNIFSSYDKFNFSNNTNKISDNKILYNWFDCNDIIRFPFDQYLISQSILPENPIVYDANQDTISRRVLYVIDKTKSNINNNTKLKKVLSSILIANNNNNKYNIDTSKLENNDLILYNILQRLECPDRKDKQNKNIKLDVKIYFGDNLICSIYENRDLDIKDLSLNAFDKLYLKTLDSLRNLTDINNVHTDFNNILNALAEKSSFGDYPNNELKVLNIISDFDHNSKNATDSIGYPLLGEKFEDISKLNIYQINLLRTTGNKTTVDRINRLMSKFREHYLHTYYYEYTQKELEENFNFENVFLNFSSTSINDNNQCIVGYYNWATEKTVFDYHGRFNIEYPVNSTATDSSYYYSIRDRFGEADTIKTYNTFFTLNNENKYLFRDYKFKKCNNSFTITTSNLNHHNYFLELGLLDHNIKFRIPIVLREILPRTASTLLIFFYIFIILTISYYITFLGIYIHKLHNSKRKRYIDGEITNYIYVYDKYNIFEFIKYWCLSIVLLFVYINFSSQDLLNSALIFLSYKINHHYLDLLVALLVFISYGFLLLLFYKLEFGGIKRHDKI